MKRHSPESLPCRQSNGSTPSVCNMRRKKYSLRSDFCRFLFAVAFISSGFQLLYFCSHHYLSIGHYHVSDDWNLSLRSSHLLSVPFAWNRLHFSSNPPPENLHIAVFLEAHASSLTHRALTLHLSLARRGHVIHVFSVYQNSQLPELHHNLHFHLSKPSLSGSINHIEAWKRFSELNSSRSFDAVHTEGTALPHFQARGLPNVVISWDAIPHGNFNSSPGCPQEESPWHGWIKNWIVRENSTGTEEAKFFDSYAHHVAANEHDASVLKKEYRIPQNRVHVIFDGVDEKVFTPNVDRGMEFRRWHGVPDSAILVLGISGDSIGEDYHHVLTEAMRQMIKENGDFTNSIFFLLVGDGSWVNAYRDISPNILILGPLDNRMLPDYYNALDILVYPAPSTQRPDKTAKEAMLSGRQVMAIRFAVETELRNETLSSEMDSVFSNNVVQVKNDILQAVRDGREVLREKGREERHGAMHLFTATKAATAYERLFLCISKNIVNRKEYCRYPHSSD